MTTARSVVRGHTLFCDDVRTEVGGKSTYVGVYNGVLSPQNGEFPINLPKLCLVITVDWFYDEMPAPALTLKVFSPEDEVMAEMEFQLPSPNEVPWLGDAQDETAHLSVTVNVAFAPIQLKKEGAIKVRLYGEGKEYKLGKLMIMASLPTLPS